MPRYPSGDSREVGSLAGFPRRLWGCVWVGVSGAAGLGQVESYIGACEVGTEQMTFQRGLQGGQCRNLEESTRQRA